MINGKQAGKRPWGRMRQRAGGPGCTQRHGDRPAGCAGKRPSRIACLGEWSYLTLDILPEEEIWPRRWQEVARSTDVAPGSRRLDWSCVLLRSVTVGAVQCYRSRRCDGGAMWGERDGAWGGRLAMEVEREEVSKVRRRPGKRSVHRAKVRLTNEAVTCRADLSRRGSSSIRFHALKRKEEYEVANRKSTQRCPYSEVRCRIRMPVVRRSNSTAQHFTEPHVSIRGRHVPAEQQKAYCFSVDLAVLTTQFPEMAPQVQG
jgi:hypothetical protein